MALPLERKPLQTTMALDPVQAAAVRAQGARSSLPMPGSMSPSVPPPSIGDGTLQMSSPPVASLVPGQKASSTLMPPPGPLALPMPASMPPLPMPASMATPMGLGPQPGQAWGAPQPTGPVQMVAAPAQMRQSPMPLPAPSTPKAFAPPANEPSGMPFAMPSSMSGGMPIPRDDESASGPLTYKVFTPEGVPGPRAHPSRTSFPEVASKPNIALRVGLVLVAACVVVGTAVLVIVGASDDGPRAADKAAAAAATASANAALGAPTPAPDPSPPVVPSASAPNAPEATGAAPPPPAPPAPAAPAAPAAKAAGVKAKPAQSGGKGVALPPNPFGGGGTPSGALKPPGKRK